MTGLLGDLRTALRQLLRSPRFLLATVPVLAVGVGATTAVFSMAHGSLLRPLPFGDADRVVKVQDRYLATGGRGGASVANFLDLRERTRTLEELAAYAHRSVNLAGEEAPVRAQGLRVTPNFFPALGIVPRVGRGFSTQEGWAGSGPVVVLTHASWEERFGGLPDVQGESILLDGVPTTVVGVLPEDFWFPGDPEFITPFAWDAGNLPSRGNRELELVGRLTPGLSPAAAQEELASIFSELAGTYPEANEGWSMEAQAFSGWAFQSARGSVRLLLGAAFLTLLVACMNVAALNLVRMDRRRKELAVRAALGAGQGRLIRLFAAESVLLAGMAALLGVALAAGGLRILMAFYGGTLPRAQDVGLSGTVLVFSLTMALISGGAAGIAPLFRLRRTPLESRLRSVGGGATRGGGKLLQGLVVVEVAVAMVVVVGAGLLTHSFWKLNQVDMGFQRQGAVTFQMNLPVSSYPDADQRSAFFQRAREEVVALPGVQSVGMTDRVPGRGGFNVTTVPSPQDPGLTASFVEIRSVSPDFFAAAGVPLLEGRKLTDEDAREGRQAIVVSDVLAATLFPTGDALGERLLTDWNETGFEIVGVVGSIREFGLARDIRPAIYWAYPGPTSGTSTVFVVRAAGDPMGLIPSIRASLLELDRNVPIYAVQSLEDSTLQGVRNRKLAANLFSLFGAIALVLSAVGIFSVLAFVVEQRTREMGIRIALGATRQRIARLVMGRGMGLVAAGVGIGLLASVASARLLQELLFEVEGTDPVTLIAMAVMALLLGALASWIPVRRAVAADPILVLKTE